MSTFGIAAAAEDLVLAMGYHDVIYTLARKYQIRPALVAAIGSRETRWRPEFFLGDIDPVTKIPHGHGPMQIDDRSFPTWCERYRSGDLTPNDGIDMGCQVIIQKRRALFNPPGGLLLGHGGGILNYDAQERLIAIAYNSGQGKTARLLIAGTDPDTGTTDGNYGADVLQRASFFSSHGFATS